MVQSSMTNPDCEKCGLSDRTYCISCMFKDPKKKVGDLGQCQFCGQIMPSEYLFDHDGKIYGCKNERVIEHNKDNGKEGE